MRKRFTFGPVLALVLLVAAPAAIAKIVVNESVAGIELGMKRAEVVDAAGEPDKERIRDHEILGRQRVMKYGKTKVSFAGKRAASEVISILTRDPDERTGKDIGIGSSKRQVMKKVDGVRCEKEFGFRHCYVGKFRAGKRVTDFFLNKDNRVKRIQVGIIID